MNTCRFSKEKASDNRKQFLREFVWSCVLLLERPQYLRHHFSTRSLIFKSWYEVVFIANVSSCVSFIRCCTTLLIEIVCIHTFYIQNFPISSFVLFGPNLEYPRLPIILTKRIIPRVMTIRRWPSPALYPGVMDNVQWCIQTRCNSTWKYHIISSHQLLVSHNYYHCKLCSYHHLYLLHFQRYQLSLKAMGISPQLLSKNLRIDLYFFNNLLILRYYISPNFAFEYAVQP